MKKILLFALFLSCAQLVFSRGISCRLPPGITFQRAFTLLQKNFSSTAKQELGFQHIESDAQNGSIVTEIRTFKLHRKTPRIGEFPSLHRPKWKKERIQMKAVLKNRIATIELFATAYNRRERKWHPVHSTGRYEETILSAVMTRVMEGIRGKTIGNLIAEGSAGTVKLKNLESFTIRVAYISFQDMKALVINLTDDKGAIWKVSIPYIGHVNDICSAMQAFFSRFTIQNLRMEVPHAYDYYWAYAVHGELMDGMHQNQVLTALGEPDEKVSVTKGTEKWIYFTGKRPRELTIVNRELHIP